MLTGELIAKPIYYVIKDFYTLYESRGRGYSENVSIIHGIILNKNCKEDLLNTRNDIVSSY